MRDFKDEVLEIIDRDTYTPMTTEEFESELEIHDAEDFKALIKALVSLEESDILRRTKKNKYVKEITSKVVKGTLSMHKRGFAFLRPEEEGLEDVFIPPNEINGALDGDTVLCTLEDSTRGDSHEGRVVKIIEHNVTKLVGKYEGSKGFGFVVPDSLTYNTDIFIPSGQNLGAVSGHKVLVEITKFPNNSNENPEGFITKILGHENDPGVDILSIVYGHGIEIEFPEEVLEQVENIPDEVLDEEKEGRVDLTDKKTITIDGEDAKDLDDAISVEKLNNGNYELTVSIADVSHYVEEGTPLDEEAYERGTSVYLVDRVIPMLPHKLSNGICSLNEGVDRLAMTCQMEIDRSGTVVNHKIFESVINSDKRTTYTAVNKILEEDDENTKAELGDVAEMIQHAGDLAKILRRKRDNRGALDFDFNEAQILVKSDGTPEDIVLRNRGAGEKLIEEFMLAANETVAENFHWLDLPFIYRIHEDPKEDKLRQFFEILTSFGIFVKGKGNKIHPHALQEILDEVKDTPEDTVISMMMLRSMQQAKYSYQSLGHFGLSTEFYTHFTAPIRRYPDLMVHRLIRTYLIEKDTSHQTINKYKEELPEIASHTSERERRAVDAERDTNDLKKAEYMQKHIGERFEGVISGVMNFGMFVELPNTVEGLVHMNNLGDDYYNYNERMMALIGERTGKVFRMGDKVEIEVQNVNIIERLIDFTIVGITPRKKVKEEKKDQQKPKYIDSKARKKDRVRDRTKKPKGKGKQPFYKSAPKRKRKRK
ncbi:ribonuclease R [Nosocomiicoccus ampullae]|uniref:Ribonuclease R n=1 Tax=Nosocomiicoccus ampullae TaxID=489910 RepID=A0A9Q2CYS2_9STAP|nr:ribonuclease R [Nosocomiicoccus ampullae]MBB5175760.1 ribonuclease R [Nosocomiicoccus ampullae]QYA47146.1 ribonuclease R [Nosocomiicoccus ampullae]